MIFCIEGNSFVIRDKQNYKNWPVSPFVLVYPLYLVKLDLVVIPEYQKYKYSLVVKFRYVKLIGGLYCIF